MKGTKSPSERAASAESGKVVARLQVRVHPRASRTEIVRWREGVLQMRVAAPPVEGAANAACLALLAETLGVPKTAITLTAGARSREKCFTIVGLSAEELRRRLPPE